MSTRLDPHANARTRYAFPAGEGLQERIGPINAGAAKGGRKKRYFYGVRRTDARIALTALPRIGLRSERGTWLAAQGRDEHCSPEQPTSDHKK